MKKQVKQLHIFAFACLVVLLAACGQTGGATSPDPAPGNAAPGGAAPQPNPGQAVKAIDAGTIIRKDGNHWLITAYVDKDDSPYIDAYSFTLNEQTVLRTGEDQNVSPDQVAVGAQVEVWHTGSVQESYPAQATAAKIILLGDSLKAPEGMISQQEAIQSALGSLSGTTAATAVKDVSLDSDNGYWAIDLVNHEAPDAPQTVHVDARSGQVTPDPIVENEAFRIFSPKTKTQVPNTFTVEGEARVFEGAFSWTLEDGHNILAEGHAKADEGAPAWGRFKFDVSYEKASQPNLMLILYIQSAKDGSTQQQLVLPLKVS